MACRKPDCVPLETVVLLLGEGWHEKEELLMAADEVTEAGAAGAAHALWAKAVARVATADATAPTAVEVEAAAAAQAAAAQATAASAAASAAAAAEQAAERAVFERASFQAAPAFEGPRDGKVFRVGLCGTGYYSDLPPLPAPRLEADRAAVDAQQAGLAAAEHDLFIEKPLLDAAGSAAGNAGGSSSDRALPVVLPRDITDYAFTDDEVGGLATFLYEAGGAFAGVCGVCSVCVVRAFWSRLTPQCVRFMMSLHAQPPAGVRGGHQRAQSDAHRGARAPLGHPRDAGAAEPRDRADGKLGHPRAPHQARAVRLRSFTLFLCAPVCPYLVRSCVGGRGGVASEDA
jgi:hypothetical protein